MAPRFIDEATLLARENEILDCALDIVSKQGLVALTMDKLVASVNYSKGTVYNHFSSKEDVFAGLCNRYVKNIMKLISRAVAIDNLSPRDHMTALGFAYMLSALISPQSFSLKVHAKTEMFEKASSARREEHDRLDEELSNIICNLIERAIEQGELVLVEGAEPKHVSFSLGAMLFGTISLLLDGEKACSHAKGMMLENRVIVHGNIVMDGLGWKKSQLDIDELLTFLKTDIFLDEMMGLFELGNN